MSNYMNKCTIKLFDIPKELIEAKVVDYVSKGLDISITEKYHDVCVTIINRSDNDILFNNAALMLNKAFQSYIYADKDISLEQCLVEKLTSLGKYVSVAESLTGGMIASRIVSVSGASRVFYEGMVTYNPGAKVRRLHVPQDVIEEKGTVNEDVARAMVKGLLSNKDVDYAFSTTGIAGPLSDEFDRPVGRVYIGYGDKKYIVVKELTLDGDRQSIRETAVNYALFFMLRYINKYN